MSTSALALLGFSVWTLALLLTIGLLRVALTVSRKRAPNSFSPQGDDVSPFSARLCRAHANCYESFPIFGGLLLLALVSDLTHLTDGLAFIALAARIAQSVVHLVSTSSLAVQIRFAFFAVQVGIWIYWAYRLAGALTA